MDIVEVDKNNVLAQAVKVIKRGGVVVFPTDTAYGLGVDATSDAAVMHLYTLKGRDSAKPMHVVVDSMDTAEQYVEVHDVARKLAQAYLPGALTLVLKDKGRVSQNIIGEHGTLGIRIPDNTFALELAREAGVPITATSANKSGNPATYSIEEVRKSFGGNFEKIAVVVDAGVLPQVAPSTLVDLTKEKPEILRDGPISREEILKVVF